MTIRHFFDKEVIVYRLRTVSGGRQSFQSTATVDCHIQEMGDERRGILGILDADAYMAYFDEDAEVNVGDVLVDSSDGTRYTVKDISKKNYSFGINRHLDAVILEENE